MVTVLQPWLAGAEEFYLMKGFNDQKKQHYIVTVRHRDPLSTNSFGPLPPFTPTAVALVQVLAWGAQAESEPCITSVHSPSTVHITVILTFQSLDLIMSLPVKTHHFLDDLSLFP